VAQYSQAIYLGRAEVDPTLNRSLRSLKRVLPGQWLLWAAKGLEAAPDGPVEGLSGWYLSRQTGPLGGAYEGLRRLMVEHLSYAGDYGPQDSVSPRLLLELVDQYRIRRGKASMESLPTHFDRQVADVLLPGLRGALESGAFLTGYRLYAPAQRRLLMGTKATTPMPPISAPLDATASILVYPPGEPPDYTKRPNLQTESQPLFPLDPLLVYVRCAECGKDRVGALREVSNGEATYVGQDPECRHPITPALLNEGV
jgi:hypothetical protein